MNLTPASALTVDELQRLLTRAEPSALLVPPRILRRVIKKDRALVGLGLQVPHRKSYVIAGDRLLRIADREELRLESRCDLSGALLLLPRPNEQRLAETDRATTLLKYWRLLFHARIHLVLQASCASDEVRPRIQRIGLTEFDEARAVLRQERFLLPPGDDRTTYEEFAAVYLELRYFAPRLLPLYFPACTQGAIIESTLTEDVDVATLFAATRPEGAPDPAPPSVSFLEDESASLAWSDGEGTNLAPSPALRTGEGSRAFRRLMERADRASAGGNMVRAAIFRTRAASLAPAGQVGPTQAAAIREMKRFAQRLQNTLDYTHEVAADWWEALLALLEPASRGIWPSESRVLYDLQKACIDRERPAFAVDLVEWFATWGRRPIQRRLPFHDSVRQVKHLRSALHRMNVIRIAEPIRRRLVKLLIDSTHHAEHRLRERLRPVVCEALTNVALKPRNIAEQAAHDKVVEELIDRVVERGFLVMGDLRDAIARNRLKLPDLAATPDDASSQCPEANRFVEGALSAVGRGIKVFLLGDRLIRANRRLAEDLDGVYHRGEIYLRWLQRFSSVAFGTMLGRLLTLYVALPFGCSLALMKVWEELVAHLPGAAVESSEEAAETARHINPYAFTLLGFFFLALFHVTPFRHGLLWVVVKTWEGLRWLFAELPAWLASLPWVVRILQSRPWLFCYQFILKPLPGAVLTVLSLMYLHVERTRSAAIGAVVFVLSSLLLNSRLGMYVEEVATDSLVRTWHLIHADLVPGLVRWILYIFRRLQEEMERLIYTVDEWLRFRPGDTRLSLFVKPVLGLLWFCFTYLFRMVFNLFVEPTFNPIKHFPVVTVAAKLIVPISKDLLDFFLASTEPVLGTVLGYSFAATAIFLLPGLAGFLVWEFKENWRLYRANQSPILQPEIVGHHGETVLRLMRPGLHSGTLPKLFARLRHGRGRSPRKQFESLHHLRERLRQFVERTLFATLAGSKSWGDRAHLHVGEIHIATNRIRIELVGPATSVHVDLEEHGGRLLAGLTATTLAETWLSTLTAEQALAFRDALGGFYKLAGVEVVREQIAAVLPPNTAYAVTERGLVAWSLSDGKSEFVYDLEIGEELLPQPSAGSTLPPLAADAVLYSATPIRWTDWVQTWQIDHDGSGHTPLVPLRMRLLPSVEVLI